MLISWIPTPIGHGWDVEPDTIVWLDVASVEASFKKQLSHYVGAEGVGAGQRGAIVALVVSFKAGVRFTCLTYQSTRIVQSILRTEGIASLGRVTTEHRQSPSQPIPKAL